MGRKRKPLYSSAMLITRKAPLTRMARDLGKSGIEMEIRPMSRQGGVYSYTLYKKRR
jgi:hypothetical protein